MCIYISMHLYQYSYLLVLESRSIYTAQLSRQ